MSSKYKKIKYATEKNVAQYLEKVDLEYKPQFPVCVIDEDDNIRIWHPDFYLPRLGLFLEVCGSERYKKKYDYRQKIYKKNGIRVVFLHYWKNESDWKNFLWTEISSIERDRVNESKKLKT